MLKALLPDPLVLFRSIATPNLELLRFLELAREEGRRPVILELTGDWFTPSVNPSKRRLAKLPIIRKGSGVQFVEVASFNQRGRQRLREMRCHDGQAFVALHHQMLAQMAGLDVLDAVLDLSAFCDAQSPRAYYERLFALFTCLGVLAENYILAGPEQLFTEAVIFPAIEATVSRFGIGPRIVDLLPGDRAADPHWDSYPSTALPWALRAAGR